MRDYISAMPHSSKRRGFLTSAMAAIAGTVFVGRRAKAADASPPPTRLRQGNPPSQPLDTMLLYERGDNNNDRLMTHEVLSLVHQEKGKISHPWTMYASLETHHEEGDACVVCSRLHKQGPGWSSGLHSEVYSHGRAVALGVNVEMSNDYTGTEPQQVIGINVQAVGGPTPMQTGLQIHDSGKAHFETAIALNGTGRAGVDLSQGKFDVGIDSGKNTIRVSEGTCIELDGKGQIKLRYKAGRIEFLNGEKCIGHIDVNGNDHAI
jgi:hypothetical protein